MPTPVTPLASRPRLCFMSYRQIRLMAMPIVAEYQDRADIEVIDGSFEVALDLARKRLDSGLVDVFVSAGSNASLLRSGISAPVATIQLSGFDILQALIKARATADRVGIVMYGHTLPELESVKGLLNIDIHQYAYQTPDSARACIRQLHSDGIRVVVGSSLVVELAENAGLVGLLAYSHASIRQGFEDALELARVAQLEAGRYEQLNTVLHTLQEAVLAVNQSEQIIAINPAMQRILGLVRAPRLGEPLASVTTDLSLRETLEGGQPEHGAVLRLQGRDWIANRTPIYEGGHTTGAALTLYDARTIHEADNSLRIQHRRSDHAAHHHFESLAGQAPAFLQAIARARRYAATDFSVLITGESGTGKELFAQAMHNASQRARRPFVAINCAAFPETLLESELFGHEEGAFTGARRGGKRGLFEAAHTGTLFLDEIGDMPLTLQTRLLRVLQERRITRLGSVTSIPVDVRVIAATHQPLLQMVNARQFRQDLYYRLNTLTLALPSLRDRKGDVQVLAARLLTHSLSRVGVSGVTAAEVLAQWGDAMEQHPWPGNVRELENLCDRIAVWLSQYRRSDSVEWSGLRDECPELFAAMPDIEQAPGAPTATEHPPEKPDRHTRALAALERHGGRTGAAAAELGVSRSTFWRWCRKPV
ncbi:propionate catabolism operon regulatory protein PrpR [Acidovorax sp. K2F]|uniref:propionate catabolism operon regulatory protein PrpR n=1 Tax=Acidovorax sp. K2F TaxID=2978125 RepID=UPI0021B0C2E5|nr:propionate catabolism operon regulatory protein PrpR [Acidovorax sp. K2F]MCT6720767.1 propionate catabolism operon regulatory protein PrpR [Acidovorax sp. K2F]